MVMGLRYFLRDDTGLCPMEQAVAEATPPTPCGALRRVWRSWRSPCKQRKTGGTPEKDVLPVFSLTIVVGSVHRSINSLRETKLYTITIPVAAIFTSL